MRNHIVAIRREKIKTTARYLSYYNALYMTSNCIEELITQDTTGQETRVRI